MFSGGESSDGVNSLNQLGVYGFVNQVAVSNAMAAGQTIDWAQLAQQWIQMRDNSELDAKVNSNRSAPKVTDSSCNILKFEEKGEADMDMDDEEQTDDKTTQKTNIDFNPTSVQSLNQSWFLGENNSPIDRRLTSSDQWNLWPNRENVVQPKQDTINNGPINPTAHIPSLLKMTVPHPNEIRVIPDVPNTPDSNNMIDAAKRKGLPAWIREGLEKMEREKQRQLEKEQKSKDIINEDNSSKTIVVSSVNSFSRASAAMLDEESSDNEETIKNIPIMQRDINLIKGKEENTYSTQGNKTYEQKLADLMIAVRRILTELLLEATNEEITKVAEETVKIFKSKASSAQVIRKSALSTLTGKLGLAAYGDSSSENDSDSEERNSAKKTKTQSESDNDTEEEIWNVIRLKRRAFIKTSEEIEEHVTTAAAREEEKLKYFLRKEEEQEKEHNRRKQDWPLVRDPSSSGHSGHNIFIGYEKDFGEITETKIQHPNGKRQKERNQRKERTTRFSDNKDKYVALTSTATLLPNINSAANFCFGKNNAAVAANNQRQNIPDINGLLPNYANTGMTNVLNAADAALEKALKGKVSASPEKKTRQHEYTRSYKQSKRRRLSERKNSRSYSRSSSSSTSTSSSSTSSDSDSSSTSQSSHHTKTKHRSAKRHKQLHTAADKKYRKSSKDRKDDRKYSSRSYEKRDRESKSSRNRRNASSDSEDDYRRRHRNSSLYSCSSSKAHSSASSSRCRDRKNSRSKSRSYSSTNHRQ